MIGAALGGGLLLGVGVAGAQAAACQPGQIRPQPEANMTRAINAARRAEGLRPLRVSGRLRALARTSSGRMIRHGVFQHDPMRWGRGWFIGQNIARARSAFIAFRLQRDSGPHRENILAPQWRTIGVGARGDCRGSLFFTVDFSASPR